MRRNFLLRDLRVIAQQVKSRSVVSSRNIWLVEEEVFNVTGIKGYLPPLRVLVAIKRHFGCQTDRQRGSLAFSSKIVKWKSRLRALSNLMKKALSSSSSLTHPSTPKVRPCLLNGVANPSRKQRQIHWTKATYVSKARYTGMVHSPKRKKKTNPIRSPRKEKTKKKKADSTISPVWWWLGGEILCTYSKRNSLGAHLQIPTPTLLYAPSDCSISNNNESRLNPMRPRQKKNPTGPKRKKRVFILGVPAASLQ